MENIIEQLQENYNSGISIFNHIDMNMASTIFHQIRKTHESLDTLIEEILMYKHDTNSLTSEDRKELISIVDKCVNARKSLKDALPLAVSITESK
jgi:hypothetical protein